jgi:uncharacterized protein YyaL (SSP411 family)
LRLFALYVKTDRYLQSALTGSTYLCALQNILEGFLGYGAFNERFTGNRWVAPRDSISAAWGLLRLYHSTKREDFLKRAELYADWHMNNAFVNDYPAAYVKFDEDFKDTTIYNCQGGSALFYYDLYTLTGKQEYLKTMQLLSDKYIDYFVGEDGSLTVTYEPTAVKSAKSSDVTPWSDMQIQ